MIKYFLGLLFWFQHPDISQSKGNCNTNCQIIIDSSKYNFVEWEMDKAQHWKRNNATDGTIKFRCSKRIKSKESDYVFSMYVYNTQFDDSRSKGADSTFVRNLGDKTVQYYRFRVDLKWFAVITFKSCDTKWVAWLYKNEMTTAEEILSGIKMSGVE